MPKTEKPNDISGVGENATEQRIVEQIFQAVADQRLRPGTKLSEASLCEAFGVGRMHVRRSLLILASREIVEIISNRGAYIASPTEKQSRDVFEARQALEPSVIKLAVERANAQDIERLQKHLEKEHAAHDNDNRQDAIRLSGAFHIMLAEIAGNDVMTRTVTELIARSSLILSVYGSPGVSSCRDDDHNALVEAFKEKNSARAVSLMTAHLNKILDHINLNVAVDEQIDFNSLFSSSN